MELALPLDPEGFVRRECPRCRREFKTRPAPSDALAIQKVLLDALPHLNGEELAEGAPVARCPYCGNQAAADAWLCEVQRRVLEEVGVSLGQHVRYEQLQQVLHAAGSPPAPTFVPVTPPTLEPAWALDPSGRFEEVHFPCCLEVVKVLAGEMDRHFCPGCGAESNPAVSEAALGRGRVARREGPP